MKGKKLSLDEEIKLLLRDILSESEWNIKKTYFVNYYYNIYINDIASTWRLYNMPASLYIPFNYKNNIIEIK